MTRTEDPGMSEKAVKKCSLYTMDNHCVTWGSFKLGHGAPVSCTSHIVKDSNHH
jgi:hypothetical protein